MLANLLVVAFVAFMAYWWGNQGFFSAVLHLASVIIAGTLALAIWEPLVVNLLLARLSDYAWGIGLLGPFIILLLIIRTAFDKLIKANVHFPHLVNVLAGGAMGFFAGVLTAGLTIIGLSFMSLGIAIGGYQPYVLGPDGRAMEHAEGNLWLGVEKHAAKFFNKMSGGTFSSSTPLRDYLPNIAEQAVLFRLHADANASLVALPGSVEVVAGSRAETPFQGLDETLIQVIGDKVRQPGFVVYTIDTKWVYTGGTYDSDRTLRVAPLQVQLVARPKDDPRAPVHTYMALGASKLQASDQTRLFVPFDSDRSMLTGTNPEDAVAFTFAVPADQEPLYLMIRRLRFNLPEFGEVNPESVGSLVGKLDPATVAKPVETSDAPPEGHVGDRVGMRTGSVARAIEVSDKLPKEFSRNMAGGTLDLRESAIHGGQSTVRDAPGVSISPANAVRTIYVPSHLAMIRVEVDRDQAQSLLGRTRAAAAMLSPIVLHDNQGQQWMPVAYAVLHADTSLTVNVSDQPFRAARELPIADMRDGERLFLYFAVNRGITITQYSVANTTQEVNLTVPQ